MAGPEGGQREREATGLGRGAGATVRVSRGAGTVKIDGERRGELGRPERGGPGKRKAAEPRQGAGERRGGDRRGAGNGEARW